jgi:hypothetical protein
MQVTMDRPIKAAPNEIVPNTLAVFRSDVFLVFHRPNKLTNRPTKQNKVADITTL